MKGAERPHSAYGGMAYMRQERPKRPFLTYEKAPMTGPEWRDFCKKSFHSKIRNERIMINNMPFRTTHAESQAIKSVSATKENQEPEQQSQPNSNPVDKKSTVSAPLKKEEPQIQT